MRERLITSQDMVYTYSIIFYVFFQDMVNIDLLPGAPFLFSCSGVTEMIFVTHAIHGVSVNFLAECKKNPEERKKYCTQCVILDSVFCREAILT